jgi:hypothetical protein
LEWHVYCFFKEKLAREDCTVVLNCLFNGVEEVPMKMPILLTLVMLGLTVLAGPVLAVPSFIADSQRFVYSGSITGYNSLADAQNGSNAQATFTLGASSRDLALYQTQQFPGDFNSNLILTNWSSQIVAGPLGTGNPSNVARGFVQLYDLDASTIGSANGYWSNAALNQFTLQVSGANALYGPDSSRLWHDPQNIGQGDDGGNFLTYSLDLTAGFNSSAVLDSNGLYMLTAEPTSVTGTFQGIFQNTESADPYQFYTFDFTIGLDGNWTWDNRGSLIDPYNDSRFGSATVVPEPLTLLLTGIGLAGLGLRRKFGCRG